jgi:hypothetical protein
MRARVDISGIADHSDVQRETKKVYGRVTSPALQQKYNWRNDERWNHAKDMDKRSKRRDRAGKDDRHGRTQAGEAD